MNDDLHGYIRQARSGGDDHQTIRERLVGAGWHPNTVNEALEKHQPGLSTALADAAMSGPTMSPNMTTTSPDPIGVVKVFSTRGVEYYLMLITLTMSATALGTLLLSIAERLFSNGPNVPYETGIMAFTSAALIVSFPIFAFLFLRLKKAELINPRLRLDQSRRRMVQIAIIVSFIVALFSTIGYLFAFLAAAYGGSDYEVKDVGLMIAQVVIILGISGGIFAYFWLDSHRKGEQ